MVELTWHRVAPGYWHAFDHAGFCGSVFRGQDRRWYPRTRGSDCNVICLAVCDTVQQAKRDLRKCREELDEPWEALGEP